MASKRPISWFYQHILGAKLSNVRNSWGAFDPEANRVFLSLWRDGIDRTDSGDRTLVLLDDPPTRPPGYTERKAHLDLMRAGVPGYGVVCVAKDVDDPVRSIDFYDDVRLLVLGALIHDGERTYAEIVDRIPVGRIGGS